MIIHTPPMRERLVDAGLYFAGAVVIAALLYLAAVGLLFLFATTPTQTSTMTCDRISQIDGSYWCMGKMNSPNDHISITRQLP